MMTTYSNNSLPRYRGGAVCRFNEKAMTTRIAIDCLRCGHCASISEEKLPHFGLEPNSSLVTITKRLICRVCGSKSVQTFRYVEDPDAPTLVPNKNPKARPRRP